MIEMTLAEIADGRRRRRPRRGHRHRRRLRRHPRPRARRPVRRRARASTSTATTTPRTALRGRRRRRPRQPTDRGPHAWSSTTSSRRSGVLARHVVDRLPDTTVLALTGSQGKTGTKDYLAHVLGAAGPTVATRGNANNELGVPLTVLRADPETRFLVVEMGARGIGPRRLPVHDRPALGRGRPQRRHRPHRRVRQPGGDRAGQGRDRRGARRRRHGRAQRRGPARRRDGGADRGPGDDLRRAAGRRGRRPTCDDARPPVLRAGAPRRRSARAPRARSAPTSGATPRPPPRWRWPPGSTSTRSRPRCARPVGQPAGGWRSASAPTGRWSSTTPTTPTPSRWRPRWSPCGSSAAVGAAYGRGARRDVRARRRRRGRRTAGSAPTPGPRGSTCSSPSARGASPTARGRGVRAVRRSSRRGVTRHCPGCARMSSAGDVVLVKASRGAALEVVVEGLLAPTRVAPKGAPHESDPARWRSLAADLADRHAATRSRCCRTRLRPGDPRRRTDQPPHQARHAHHGRHRHHLATVVAYFAAKLITLQTPSRLGDAAALPVRRAGHGRVPRRLHQDQPAAQPRPAQPREDDRADPGRRRLRRPGALAGAGGRARPAAGVRPHLFIRDSRRSRCRPSW